MIGLRMNVIAGSTKNLLVDLQNGRSLARWGFAQFWFQRRRFVAEEANWLLCPAPMVEAVLKASNIDQVIPIFHELDAAVDSLR